MSELRTLYNVTNKIIQNSEVGNYFPPKIYTDVAQIRYQREKKQNQYQKDKPKRKLNLKIKKNTFLDQIQERQAKLPSPHSYNPVEYEASYKNRKLTNLPSRETIFAYNCKQNTKNPVPSPTQYQNSKKKSCSLVCFQKSENTNFLDAVVHKSANSLGVGEYNVGNNHKFLSRHQSLQKMGKFDKASRSQSCKQNKLPSSVSYNPIIPDKKLFSQLQKSRQHSSTFNKEKRFEGTNKNINKNLYYTGISEWGMKTSYKKKDLLATLSTHNIYSKSVYYH